MSTLLKEVNSIEKLVAATESVVNQIGKYIFNHL